jgi:23S rRNA-/tRNA-specific pseudouridylate synthase
MAARRGGTLGVLWSDGSTLVLHKPAGLAVQDIPAQLNRLLQRPPGEPVWLPHRIDKFTRGLQVATVCKEACSALNRSSEQRRWRKRYRALACVPSDSATRERSPLVREDGSLVPEGWLVSGILRRELAPGAAAS